MKLITKQTKMKTIFATFALMSSCGAVSLSASELSGQAPFDETVLAQSEFILPHGIDQFEEARRAIVASAILASIRERYGSDVIEAAQALDKDLTKLSAEAVGDWVKWLEGLKETCALDDSLYILKPPECKTLGLV